MKTFHQFCQLKESFQIDSAEDVMVALDYVEETDPENPNSCKVVIHKFSNLFFDLEYEFMELQDDLAEHDLSFYDSCRPLQYHLHHQYVNKLTRLGGRQHSPDDFRREISKQLQIFNNPSILQRVVTSQHQLERQILYFVASPEIRKRWTELSQRFLALAQAVPQILTRILAISKTWKTPSAS